MMTANQATGTQAYDGTATNFKIRLSNQGLQNTRDLLIAQI
ncbi:MULTISPECIES: hypothetical protein [unclassified Coleofasciculus]|nr:MULTISPECIES: hypothetical protein [unclassified Coleofasciculus]